MNHKKEWAEETKRRAFGSNTFTARNRSIGIIWIYLQIIPEYYWRKYIKLRIFIETILMLVGKKGKNAHERHVAEVCYTAGILYCSSTHRPAGRAPIRQPQPAAVLRLLSAVLQT